MTYPDETLQGFVDPSPWWVRDDGKKICRGRLCWAFVPFISQTPLTLEPVGRTQPTAHHEANAKIEPLQVRQTRKMNILPVAALPLLTNELYTVYKAKKRPCLILGDGCSDFPGELCRDRPSWQVAHTVIVAPFFGIDSSAGRAGFPPGLVKRVKKCEFPQFFWDTLPHTGKESMMLLMQAQPIGKHEDSIECTPYKLSTEALCVMDEWLHWALSGTEPSPRGTLSVARDILLKS